METLKRSVFLGFRYGLVFKSGAWIAFLWFLFTVPFVKLLGDFSALILIPLAIGLGVWGADALRKLKGKGYFSNIDFLVLMAGLIFGCFGFLMWQISRM